MKFFFIAAIFLLLSSPAFSAEIILDLSGQSWEGDPEFLLRVNENEIGKGTVPPTGKKFFFKFNGEVKRVALTFTNDRSAPKDSNGNRSQGTNRNLVVHSIHIDGRKWVGKMLKTPSNGYALAGDSLILGGGITVEVPVSKDSNPTATRLNEISEQPLFRYSAGSNGITLLFLGDSLTIGAGASNRSTSYPAKVSSALGDRRFSVIARGGAPSDKIGRDYLTNAFEIPDDAVSIIWAGRNNYTDIKQVQQDIAYIVARLPNRRFIILSILAGLYPNEQTGEVGGRQIDALNRELEKTYGFRFLRVGDDLMADDRVDNIHLTDEGYAKIAAKVSTSIRIKGW